MITIKEIAKECGLSATAVSKALRGEKDISLATIEKVKETAKRLGYIRNPAAVRLKTNRSYNFGVLIEDATNSGITHELFAYILNSFINKSRENGYTVTFISDKFGSETLSYQEYANIHGCDGVLVLVHKFNDIKLLEFVESKIPVVVLDYTFDNCSSIMSDNENAMNEMVKYAYDMGHRRIAFIHGKEKVAVTQLRLAGFKKACEELGVEINPDYIREGVYHDTQSAEDITYELLDLETPPTFIFYQDDYAFIGGMNAMENRNVKIGEDISVAGFDGMSLTQIIRPKLMTWKQNTGAMGEEAVNLLMNSLENADKPTSKIISVKGELLKGNSVKNLNN